MEPPSRAIHIEARLEQARVEMASPDPPCTSRRGRPGRGSLCVTVQARRPPAYTLLLKVGRCSRRSCFSALWEARLSPPTRGSARLHQQVVVPESLIRS